MVTLTQFSALQRDMSYEKVCEHFGETGTLISSETAQIEPGLTFDSILTEVLEWSGQEGGACRIMFKSDRLNNCTQEGLE